MRKCFGCGLDQQCCVDLHPVFSKAIADIPLEPVDTYFERTEALRLDYYEQILKELPVEVLVEAEPNLWNFKLSLKFIKGIRGIS